MERDHGEENSINVDAAYRRFALQVIFAFRTLSTKAALLIARMMPLRILGDIERRKHLTNRRTALVQPAQVVVRLDFLNKGRMDLPINSKYRRME